VIDWSDVAWQLHNLTSYQEEKDEAGCWPASLSLTS